MKINTMLIAALSAASVLLSACVVTPDPYYDRPVRVAPPPMRMEYQGYPPAPEYLWVSGYWGWYGSRYEWVPGRWEAPRPGYLWVPHRWERDGDHWRQSGGRWEQDAHHHHGPERRIETMPPPRTEPRREWGGDPRDQHRDQPRVEPRPVAPVGSDSGVRHGHDERGSGRPVPSVLPARPAPAAAPVPAPAPAAAPARQHEDRHQGERRDESRNKRRQPGDER
jgi:hypothetical protein